MTPPGLTNATLESLATATTTAAGGEIWPAATAINARCAMSDVNARQRADLGVVILDAKATLRVLKSAIAIEPRRGQKVIAAIDNSSSRSYRIVWVRNQEKRGGLAHWECFLQELPGGAA